MDWRFNHQHWTKNAIQPARLRLFFFWIVLTIRNGRKKIRSSGRNQNDLQEDGDLAIKSDDVIYHDCYLFKLKMVDSPKPKDFHGQCEDGVREHHGSLGILRCWYGESSYQWPGLFTGNQGMEQRQSNIRFHQDWIDWKGIHHSNIF